MVKLKIAYIFLLLLALVSSMMKFQVNLVRALSKNYASSDNYMMAPFAVSQALAMMFLQKDRRRDYQLASALRVLGQSPDNIISYINDAYEIAAKQKFLMGNLIFSSADFLITQNMKNMSQRLNVGVEKVNFSDGPNAAKEINSRLGKEIDDAGCQVLSKEKLTDKTKMVAVQGLSVTTVWRYPFQSIMKKKLTIEIPDKMPIFRDVDLMYTYGPFDYLIQDDVRGITIPLAINYIYMIIFQPRLKTTTQHILQNLDKYLTLPMEKMKKVHLYLPRFTLKTTLDVAGALKSLSIKKVFTETNNNTIFKQQNILTVKANRHLLRQEYQDDDDQKVVIVNRPFVFVIKSPKAIYMAGRVDSMTDLKIVS